MSNGLIATIIGIVSVLLSFLLGKKAMKTENELKEQVAESKSESIAKGIETASARVAAEAVSDLFKAEEERKLTDVEITQRLASASSDEDVFKLAQIMAERAAERINRKK